MPTQTRPKFRGALSGGVTIHGAKWDYIDYLTEEMVTTFRLGKGVWESGEVNHKTQKDLLINAMNRAKLRYKLQENG